MNKLIPTYKVSDFDYYLPEGLIAQTPLKDRQSSRLMHMNRITGEIRHEHFYDIVKYLNENDVLVLNNTRVIPARLYGKKQGSGGSVEMLLLKPYGDDVWEVLIRPGKRVHEGNIIEFADGKLTAEIIRRTEDGGRVVRLAAKDGNVAAAIDKTGEMPLPHYIKEKLTDRERYQTVYSKVEGSAAAPTAGLHFTNELLEKIKNKGVKTASVTLHVGVGTFRPVTVENVTEHKMHSEWFELTGEAADIINGARINGGRIIAVGTTSARTLESCADESGRVIPQSRETDIFIYPPYKFKAVDALITNFHLPKSTLMMLVSAFSSLDNVRHAYEEAVKIEYRFFSFGDAMFIE
ncbi:MAG: tRNA preQ1(34) S-adenosylmethionine ribosyltransferase-isomerase QueA [Clostridia bacterium]|nr:tRNA preQ1(34) S-adenosylmethionine ribosyltransferase-isomerase QueA [Clostridia bacterium]